MKGSGLQKNTNETSNEAGAGSRALHGVEGKQESVEARRKRESSEFRALRERRKQTVKQDIVEVKMNARAYVPQGYIGVIECDDRYNSTVQYLATSGLAPCLGITVYSSTKKKKLVILGHFDSSHKPNIEQYMRVIAIKIKEFSDSADIMVTLIPSTNTLKKLSDASVGGDDADSVFVEGISGENIGQGKIKEKTSEIMSQIKIKQSRNIYDDMIVAIDTCLPKIQLCLKPFIDIQPSEDIVINIQTGKLSRYKELRTKVTELKPQEGKCLREDFNMPSNMEFYFLKGGQLYPVQFAEVKLSSSKQTPNKVDKTSALSSLSQGLSYILDGERMVGEEGLSERLPSTATTLQNV